MRRAQGNNLCAYYVCENMHKLVAPRKSLAEWQQEVSRKLVNVSTLIVKVILNISTFPYVEKMCNQLILEERVLAIQGALCGFIVDQVLDRNGKFYYDGESYIDNMSKYDNIV